VPKCENDIYIFLCKNGQVINANCIFLYLRYRTIFDKIKMGICQHSTHVNLSAPLAPYWSARMTISSANMPLKVIARTTDCRMLDCRSQNDFILRSKITFMLCLRSRGEKVEWGKPMSLMCEKRHAHGT